MTILKCTIGGRNTIVEADSRSNYEAQRPGLEIVYGQRLRAVTDLQDAGVIVAIRGNVAGNATCEIDVDVTGTRYDR